MPILRVRTGCLTCRRRKKKCDEIRPVCSGCTRNRLSCNWPQRNHHDSPVRPRTATTATVTSAHPPQTAAYDAFESQELPLPSSVSLDLAHEPTQPTVFPGSSAELFSNILPQRISPLLGDMGAPHHVSPAGVTGPISPESSSSSTSTGTATRPFDQRSPFEGFGDATQDLLPQGQQQEENAVFDFSAIDFVDDIQLEVYAGNDAIEELSQSSQPPPTPLANGEVDLLEVPRSISLLPGMGSPSFELLGHYMSVTSRSMGNGATDDNPFDVQLIPLAFGSELILHLILTQSAVHRATRLLDTADAAASNYYHKSLQLFRHRVTKCNDDSVPEVSTLAAGALILCFVETAKGDIHGRIFDHLIAARPLLHRLLSQKSTIPQQLLDFLVEYYVYTATLSIVSIDSRVGPQFLLADPFEAYAHTLIARNYVGSLCGCWLELLLHIPIIFQIGRRFLADSEASRPIDADDFALFAHVQMSIKNWSPSTSVRADVAVAGKVYQQAMLLYLYTALAPISSTGSSAGSYGAGITAALNDAFEALEQLPFTARINTSLCWPIVVIGSCVDDEPRREVLQARLEVMFSTIGLGNIRQTLTLLEQIWKVPGINPWSVCQVMQDSQIWISFA